MGPLAAGEPGAGVQQRPDGVESVGGDQSPGDAVPQAFLDLGGEATGDGLEVGVEQRALPAQGVEHLPPGAGGGLGRHRGPAVGLEEPGQILPQHEGDGRPAGRRLARAARLAGRGIVALGGRLDQGQPAPHHLARQAQVVEPFGTIRLDPLGEEPLPLPGRPLEALELLDHLGQSGPALATGPGSGVPPGLEEVLPLLLADGTDLGAPALAGVAVDAGQQPAGAPLLAPLGLELPADREPACPEGPRGRWSPRTATGRWRRRDRPR